MKLATLCYLKRDGQTLMVYRNKKEHDIHEGKWNGLGGKFEVGESPEDCVIREILEESGYTIRNPKLQGVLSFPNFKGDDWYVFVYIAREIEGELNPDCKEGKLEWITDSELKNLKLNSGDYVFFDWLERGKIFSAKFIYTGDELKSHSVAFH